MTHLMAKNSDGLGPLCLDNASSRTMTTHKPFVDCEKCLDEMRQWEKIRQGLERLSGVLK